MKNLEMAKILYAIADILELQGVQFKPQAYRRAAQAIENLSEDLEMIQQQKKLDQIPGVGKSIAEKIIEYLETGKVHYYEKLKKQVDIDFEQLLKIPTLGPKRIKILYQKLKVRDLEDLEKALRSGKVRTLRGFGAESEKHLTEGLKRLRSSPQRMPYVQAEYLVKALLKYFKQFDFMKRVEIAGSFRRGRETIGDLDFLIVSDTPQKVMKAFVSYPYVKKVLAVGNTKSSILLASGIQVDVRVVKGSEFGAALIYFIGNKEHNIELRKLALSKGYTLSEYGLFDLKTKKRVAGRTEQEVYDRLGLDYMAPELRENNGEIKAALNHKLPQIITEKDIKGIFHNHSLWSDGNNTLLQMAQAAEQKGFKWIAFNDHYDSVGIVNPLNERRLSAYLREIDKVRKNVGIEVLSGIEIDIRKDGSLALPASKFKQLDVVIASIHTSMNLPEAEMTARVIKAMEKYPINILGHPTGIELGQRTPIALNLDRVFETALKNKVFLEINSAPKRLDLAGHLLKSAKELGCKFALSTDAHEVTEVDNYKYGVICARRGWLEKKDVLNCWSLDKIRKALQR